MADKFDYFVIFAEMRTGSNFLETNLNGFDAIACHGEAFNPHFIAYPKRREVLGITQAQRDEEPGRLIGAIRGEKGVIGGFRFFHDHDPRVLDMVLNDRRCAKIILTRNPLDSYVSWKIAQATGQWKLTDVKRRKDARVRFDIDEFTGHIEVQQDFQVLLLNRLQTSGQAGFHVAYEDLQDVAVMNGLARWLGVDERLDSLDKSLKRQNPGPIVDKVSNPDEMIAGLAGLDRFNLTRTPNFEPRRGPAVPTHVAGANTPLLFMPVGGGPVDAVSAWLAALDGVETGALTTGMNQKQLRRWKRRNPGHRSFTVLRHPLARAHAAFCERILSTGPGSYAQIRETLRKSFDVSIPRGDPGKSYDRAMHRKAFMAFLEFVRANLAGQTGIRIDPVWCSQTRAIAGFGDFLLPDLILREDELTLALPELAARFGHESAPSPALTGPATPHALADIYDDELESLASDVYQRDYLMFGFGPWKVA